MPDVYWIARGEIKSPSQDWNTSLRQNGMQIEAGWIQAVHWIGSEAPDSFVGGAPLSFSWPEPGGLAVYLLHDACRAILNGEYNLVSLVETSPAGIEQTLLASPQAVGQHNLFPRAHLPFWWASPPGKLAKTAQRLDKAGFDPARVGWLAGDDGLLASLGSQFPGARPLPGQPTGTISQLNALVQKLIETRSELGLLACQMPGGPQLFTLVEL